jgi:uracil-DNA glycosylase
VIVGRAISEQELSARQETLRRLAAKRAADSWGYKNLADFHGGAHECAFVSPYTKSAGNVASDIVVMLQDWASEEGLSGPLIADSLRLGYTPNVGTDINLIRLLGEHFKVALGDVYATNLFPFIKRGGMSSAIPRKDLVRAAKAFGWPQIEAIRPRLVIALGLDTFNALCEGVDVATASKMDLAIRKPVDRDATRVWCQAHTGGRGLANRGGKVNVSADWAAMAAWYFSRAA